MKETKKAVMLVEHHFEDLELWYPVYRLREANVEVLLAGPEAGKTYMGKHGVPAKTDINFNQLDANSTDALLIPGGWAPDKLRRDSRVLEFVERMYERRKIIATICHAGWVLVSAKVVKNKKITSTEGIRDDLTNAGANWLYEPVVVDLPFISSRRPGDLPIYAKTILEHLL